MEGHTENFVATRGRIYYIYNCFENLNKNFFMLASTK